MKEEIYTFQYVVTDEYFNRNNFTKEDSEREINDYMFKALADELAKQIEIHKEPWGPGSMYRAQVALLTPKRFRHLLHCERRLKELYRKLDEL